MLRIAWGPSALGAPSADPGPSPPAPPRARARPASYARRLSLPHQHRGGEGPRLVGEPRPQTRAGPYGSKELHHGSIYNKKHTLKVDLSASGAHGKPAGGRKSSHVMSALFKMHNLGEKM